jgi:hypothetical protein
MTQPLTPDTPLSPISPSLDAARAVLAAVLDSTRAADTDRLDTDRLAAAEALAALSEVRPPYPPPNPGQAGHPHALLADALDRLDAAIGEAGSIDELTRIATAALILRRRSQDQS